MKRQEILDRVKSEEKQKRQQEVVDACSRTHENSSEELGNKDNKEDEFDLKLMFVESEKFEGKRRGFHFGTSDFGLGYYRDFSLVPEEKPKSLDSIESETKSITLTDSSISDTLVLNENDKKELDKIMPAKKQDKENKEPIQAKESCITPEYRYQQTLRAINMIVDVKDVEKESVKCKFENRRVKITTENSNTANIQDETQETGYLNVTFYVKEKTGEKKLFSLEVILLHSINPSECKYNVAANNMLLIMGKKQEGIWASVVAPGGTILLASENIKGNSQNENLDLDTKIKDLSIQGNDKHLKEENNTSKIDLSGIKITNPRLFELD